MATDYDSKVFGKIDAKCHMGLELHVMTSKAFNTRVLNLRLYRMVPAFSGHTGYTKQGFMLSKEEVSELHSFLTEAMSNQDLWDDDDEGGVVPIGGGDDQG